jgi:hypothetical protein
MKSGAAHSGDSALDIVEKMRQADFDPPPTVRDYIAVAVARASHYFGVTMKTDAKKGTEEEAAERFLAEAIEKGFAEEERTS